MKQDRIGAGEADEAPRSAAARRRVALVAIALIGAVLSTGAEANASNISANGRLVVFTSQASNLVRGGDGRHDDVFVRDRSTGRTRRVSVSLDGGPTNGFSIRPSISADGRFVAFQSAARNLVPDDNNNATDIFVYDIETGETRRVSLSSAGDEANGPSFYTSISGDGRFVAFESHASNLVEGDTGIIQDIFVHDLHTGETRRVSVSSSGAEANGGSVRFSISADGRRVAFWSGASNLVAGDANDASDVFVHDLETRETTRVSVSSGGAEANDYSLDPSISADGRRVAFWSEASNLVANDMNDDADVFLHDLETGKTRRVSRRANGGQADGYSVSPSISPDGRSVAFQSSATNLVRADTNGVRDVFVRNMRTGNTRRVSVSSRRREGDLPSGSLTGPPSISANGRQVVFESGATNLVRGDTNRSQDVFVRNLRTRRTRRVSVSSTRAQGNGDSCVQSCVV